MIVTLTDTVQLESLKRIGRIVAQTFAAMKQHARPGMNTLELDDFGAALLRKFGAHSAPRKDYDFPGATCISVNEEAAHGIPSTRVLATDDLINIDVSAEMDGYYADTGGSFVLGQGDEQKNHLCACTAQARDVGIAAAHAGQRLNRVGRTIERVAQRAGLRVVRNLCGHGVGMALHEEPTLRNYYDPRDTEPLLEGQVVTIEPYFSNKSSRVKEAEDGWTLLGQPGSLFAQYEHTIVVTRGAPIIITLP